MFCVFKLSEVINRDVVKRQLSNIIINLIENLTNKVIKKQSTL